MAARLRPPSVHVRDATPADAFSLTMMAQRTIAACYRRFFGINDVIDFLKRGSINDYVVGNLEKNYCVVLMLGSVPVGFAVLIDHTIDLIMIDHQEHRRGLGTQLLAHCEAAMFEAHQALTLRCFEQNEQANNFFRKNGWEVTLTYRNRDLGERTVLYQKQALATASP